MKVAPIISISRFRIGTDGKGITTLVGFYGCPMKCKYCLNPKSIKSDTQYYILSPGDLFKHIVKDELYYISTGGGVTFGGGEPLLYSSFIEDVLLLGASKWNTTIETSFNIPTENITKLLGYNIHFIVDTKDMNPEIYKKYTGNSNDLVIRNLRWISENGFNDRVTIRLPLIPMFNGPKNISQSEVELKKYGYKEFDKFDYITNITEYKNERKRTMQYPPNCTF